MVEVKIDMVQEEFAYLQFYEHANGPIRKADQAQCSVLLRKRVGSFFLHPVKFFHAPHQLGKMTKRPYLIHHHSQKLFP